MGGAEGAVGSAGFEGERGGSTAGAVALGVVWGVGGVGNSGRSGRGAGSTVGHDAEVTLDALGKAGKAGAEGAAAGSKAWGRSSVRRHARPVAQDVVMAVWRLGHFSSTGRSAGSAVSHDAKLTVDSLSHAGNAEAE